MFEFHVKINMFPFTFRWLDVAYLICLLNAFISFSPSLSAFELNSNTSIYAHKSPSYDC